MGKDKGDDPQEEYSVEKVLQKRTRNGKVRFSVSYYLHTVLINVFLKLILG